MAGPGIRYHYVAKTLSKHFDVTLAVYNPADLAFSAPPGYRTTSVHVSRFQKEFDRCDFIFSLWLNDEMLSYANIKGKVLIFDLYAPVPVENLISYIFSGTNPDLQKDVEFSNSIKQYKKFFALGDFFVCSNERQRDFWQGFIFATGLIMPTNVSKRPLLDKISLAPMGISKHPPIPDRGMIRGRIGDISEKDIVIVWTGGIWDWFDAETLIKAMVNAEPDIKLVFLGVKHPNENIPMMQETIKAKALAKEMGLLDKTVYMLEGWIDYKQRLGYLMDADAAIYTHKESIETRFSHRTRVLDHILMELPTIASEGDYFSEIIKRERLGIVVPIKDQAAITNALNQIRKPEVRTELKRNIQRIKPQFYWETTLAPLVYFIKITNPLNKVAREYVLTSKPLWLKIVKRVLPFPLRRVLRKFLASIN